MKKHVLFGIVVVGAASVALAQQALSLRINGKEPPGGDVRGIVRPNCQ